MKDSWTDFEKYVFGELKTISHKISKLEGRAATWGALAGVIVAGITEVLVKAIWHQ